MTILEAFPHAANFLAPSIGLGTLAALATKLLWRGALAQVAWWRLATGAAFASAAAAFGGLVVSGHDGRMATYAAMVVAAALALWWQGFRPGR